MKWLLALVVVLLGSVVLVEVIQQDPGFILIGYKHWTIETSLALAGLTIVVAFGLFHALLRSMAWIFNLPRTLQIWQHQRQLRASRRSLTDGLIALAEGHWSQAEKKLIRAADRSETPLLNYLGAARAAQKQGSHEARDRYLALAHERVNGADIAIALTQAELQIAHQQLEQALATLANLRTMAPKHAYVLRLLMRLYCDLKDWNTLYELLPDLKKHKVTSDDEFDTLSLQVHSNRLIQAAHNETDLVAIWNAIPKALRKNSQLLNHYLDGLERLNLCERMDSLIQSHLKQHWDDKLILRYGRLQDSYGKVTPTTRLALAEGWLQQQDRNPRLLLSLARLSRTAKLWGKARSYLEASIGSSPLPEAYQELGELLEQLQEPEKAAECYQKGLQLALQHNPRSESARLLPATAGDADVYALPTIPTADTQASEHSPAPARKLAANA